MHQNPCKKYLKLVAVIGTVIVAILALIVIVRTISIHSPPAEETCNVDASHYIPLTQAAIERLSTAISIKTVSHETTENSHPELLLLQQFIIKSFPLIHSSSLVFLEVVNNYSLLYKVQGSDPSLTPYFLAAHLDVVPADPERWDVPPFEGTVQDGFVYGRGTLDDKSQFLGILEALEALLKSGFAPKRGFYIGFGHDEEIHGYHGAREMGRLLIERGVKLVYLIDEGTMITKDIVKMVDNPVAVISVAEKGLATFRMTVEGVAAHSSVPPRSTSIGILAKAITRLEENPHVNRFGLGTEKTMLELLAPYASFSYKMIFANLWLFSGIVSRIMAHDPLQNALLRTTTAVTMVNGGIKSNVIPAKSWAVVNHRIYPSESVAQVLEYDRKIVNDDRIEFEILGEMEPAPISPFSQTTFGFQTIKKSIKQIFPSVIVVPGLMIGATDTKWYHQLTDQIYRFSPYIITPNDTTRYHGDNERIAIQNYEQLINFYHHLIINSDVAQLVVETKEKTEL